jgi:hypothetical protein
MMVISSLSASDPVGNYSAASTSGQSASALSGSGLPTQDSINLQLDTSLLQSLSQTSAAAADTADFPTNIQQAVQDQVTLTTNSNLAQTISQQESSASVTSQTEALQTLSAENGSTQSAQSLTSLATSMSALQDITNTGILTSNSSLAQSLLQNYTVLTNPASLGSLVDASV